jgi:hypothetical protein
LLVSTSSHSAVCRRPGGKWRKRKRTATQHTQFTILKKLVLRREIFNKSGRLYKDCFIQRRGIQGLCYFDCECVYVREFHFPIPEFSQRRKNKSATQIIFLPPSKCRKTGPGRRLSNFIALALYQKHLGCEETRPWLCIHYFVKYYF